MQKKNSLRSAVLLGEGIFTMGIVKTIYNVLGGFYSHYNSMDMPRSVNKHHKISRLFLCTSYKVFPFSLIRINTKLLSCKHDEFIACILIRPE